MKDNTRFFQIVSLAALALHMIAEAHPLHWSSESIGFINGLFHPINSSDHIFTMLLVGFWISQANRRTIYLMSFIFVTLMLIGGGLTLIPVEIIYAQNVMYLSALLLGSLMVSGFKVSSLLAVLVVGALALSHGYVHAYDIWLDIDAFGYTLGFALATVALITVGIAIRSLIDRFKYKNITRFLGEMSER